MVDTTARRMDLEQRREPRFGLELRGIAWRAKPPRQYVRGSTVNMSRNGFAFCIGKEESSTFAAGDSIRFEIGVCTDLLRHSEAILQGAGTVVRIEPWTLADQFLLGVRTRITKLTRRPQTSGVKLGPSGPSGLAKAS